MTNPSNPVARFFDLPLRVAGNSLIDDDHTTVVHRLHDGGLQRCILLGKAEDAAWRDQFNELCGDCQTLEEVRDRLTEAMEGE